MKVGIYLRVSTNEQTVEPQREELVRYCAARGWTDVREYADKVSGAKFSRMGLELLMRDVRRHAIKAVVCVKLDRLGRSLPHLAQLIGELTSNGVALVCPGQGIDTSDNNPAGRLQMHVLMAVAEFERELIR
jgi:putative DNA-invertase from lambdoid prophage Rac